LRARFRIDLKEYDDALQDDEPIELDSLEKYLIRQELLTERIDTGTSNLEIFAARGVSAPGLMGSCNFAPSIGMRLTSVPRFYRHQR
jgi:Exodeoxyribonuclease V, gamma subunit.